MNAIVEIHQDIMATLYSHIVGQLAVKMNSQSVATWGNNGGDLLCTGRHLLKELIGDDVLNVMLP